MPQDPPSWYDIHARELAGTYESIEAARLHAWMEDLLPAAPALAADIGAGTGRDAAWLASRGMDVVAVEPSMGMREQAAHLHAEAKVRWLADSLPDLRELLRMGLSWSSTYKLALLRSLGRIADGAAGYVRARGDDEIAVPLGLVALYWIRLFKPLLDAGLPQSPRNRGLNELGFVKDGFRALAGLSHLDLRVGMIFTGSRGAALHSALQDAAKTIAEMPARHLKYPKGGVVFPVEPWRKFRAPSTITLDEGYLSSFGVLAMPLNLWKALQRFDAWIDPALVAEWKRLMQGYALSQGRQLPEPAVGQAMTWSDPARDVRIARERALHLLGEGPLHCVWSGRILNAARLDVDHCFPWAAWPCDHLWNLMPCLPAVNNRKRDRLPDDATLRGARDRILEWWDRGYRSPANPALAGRFMNEARAGLPAMPDEGDRLEDVFAGLALQRLRLSHDQQVPDWSIAGQQRHGE